MVNSCIQLNRKIRPKQKSLPQIWKIRKPPLPAGFAPEVRFNPENQLAGLEHGYFAGEKRLYLVGKNGFFVIDVSCTTNFWRLGIRMARVQCYQYRKPFPRMLAEIGIYRTKTLFGLPPSTRLSQTPFRIPTSSARIVGRCSRPMICG